eukprot:tig00000144_g9105.t1
MQAGFCAQPVAGLVGRASVSPPSLDAQLWRALRVARPRPYARHLRETPRNRAFSVQCSFQPDAESAARVSRSFEQQRSTSFRSSASERPAAVLARAARAEREAHEAELARPESHAAAVRAHGVTVGDLFVWALPAAALFASTSLGQQLLGAGSVLTAVSVLATTILVHELGHFWAARAQGIRVSSFSLGFGPILWRYRGTETEYSVRAFPLGGFVGFPDPAENVEGPEDERLLQNRPVRDRAIVISAGVIANLIFSYFTLFGQVATVGVVEPNYKPGIVVPKVASDMTPVAQRAGIKAGDVILAVDGAPLEASPDSPSVFVDIMKRNTGEPLRLSIQRGADTVDVKVVPDLVEGERRLGIVIAPNASAARRRVTDPGEIVALSASEFRKMLGQTAAGLSQLVGNFSRTSESIAGPIGVVAAGSSIARNDSAGLFSYAALLSINLAVINILPLPALDGGQLLFVLIEAVRGRPLPQKLQDQIQRVAVLALLLLSVFLIFRDAANLVSK